MRRTDVGLVGFMAGVVVAMVLTPEPEPEVIHETFVRTVEVEAERPWVDYSREPRPDYDEAEGYCLYDLMVLQGHELTLQNVITAGDWADMNGGACALLALEEAS